MHVRLTGILATHSMCRVKNQKNEPLVICVSGPELSSDLTGGSNETSLDRFALRTVGIHHNLRGCMGAGDRADQWCCPGSERCGAARRGRDRNTNRYRYQSNCCYE